MTEPIADGSATDDPEMPLKNVVAMIFTADKPPRTRTKPTSTFANATRRFAMPPSAMMAPASTKNGIVSIATLLTPSEIFSITASSGTPIHSAPAIAASPNEYAIGIPIANSTNRQPSKTRISMGRGLGDLLERGDGVGIAHCVHRTAQPQMLDDEQQQNGTADRDRQIGDAHGKRRKIRDRVRPGRFDESHAFDRH